LYFRIDLELHYFHEFSNVKVIADMEPEEKLPNQSLPVNHFAIDALNYHGK
jgi:hypothetical protein